MSGAAASGSAAQGPPKTPRTEVKEGMRVANTGEEAVRHRAKFIAVYSYKGGVMKTTTTRELSSTLALLGHRVGMADLDYQCNLTSYFLSDDVAQGADEEPGEEDLLQAISEGDSALVPSDPNQWPPRVMQNPLWPGTHISRLEGFRRDNEQPNIYDVMQPLFDGDRSKFRSTPLKLHKVLADVPCLIEQNHRVPNTKVDLWLLPGSVRMVEVEAKLEQAANLRQPNWLGGFRALFNKMAAEYDLDFVIIDCSPSSGVLNKLGVMSCDYILPTGTPDPQNLCSLDGMLRYVLPAWIKFKTEIMVPNTRPFSSEGDQLQDFAVEVHGPMLMPVLVHNYMARTIKKNCKHPSRQAAGGGKQAAGGGAKRAAAKVTGGTAKKGRTAAGAATQTNGAAAVTALSGGKKHSRAGAAGGSGGATGAGGAAGSGDEGHVGAYGGGPASSSPPGGGDDDEDNPANGLARVVKQPSMWILEMRYMLANKSKATLPDSVRALMLPEEIQHNGTTVRTMVWAFMKNDVSAALGFSAQCKWPLVWLPDYRFYHPDRNVQGRPIPTEHVNVTMRVRERWLSLARWITYRCEMPRVPARVAAALMAAAAPAGAAAGAPGPEVGEAEPAVEAADPAVEAADSEQAEQSGGAGDDSE